MNDDEETYGIVPHKIYRKFAKETQEILGLGRTAIEEAIDNDDIPRPLPLTEHGSATGWMGTTLIALQRKRLTMAAERKRLAQAEEQHAAGASPQRRNRKRKEGRSPK